MTDYRALLRQTLASLPAEDRDAFVREVLASLDDVRRAAILTETDAPERAVANDDDRSTTPLPPTETAAPPIPEPAPPAKPETVETAFHQFKIQQDAKLSQGNIRRELWSCIGLAVLVLATIAILSVGGRAIYDWVLSLL